MKISILQHPKSWFNFSHAKEFIPTLLKYTEIHNIFFEKRPQLETDFCFALHYPSLLTDEQRKLHKNNIVIHGANLPDGRGRCPIHWQVEEGKNDIFLTMFEMGDEADNGPVYRKSLLSMDGTELLGEIRIKTVLLEVQMVDWLLANWPVTTWEQVGAPTFYEKRNQTHQELDPNMTIAEQFNRIRVSDNDLYPLWFKYKGQEYKLHIYKSPMPSYPKTGHWDGF